jgi:hypothetical protein
VPNGTAAGRRRTPALLILSCLVLAASLGARLLYRRYFYVGWEIIGAAYGQHLLSTESAAAALGQVFWNTRHFLYWGGMNSVFWTIIPGALGAVVPWEYWSHVVTFALATLSVVLLARAVGVTARAWPYLILGLASSATTLSFAVNGGPYLSGWLPHAMAVAITQSGRCRRSPWLSLLLALLTVEVSWHCHGMGRLHFLVFLAGATLIAGVRTSTRSAWVAAALLEIWLLWRFERPAAGGYLVGHSLQVLAHLGTHVYHVFQAFWLSTALDVPVLAWIGLTALFVVRKDAWFFRAIYLAQLAPLVVMAVGYTEGLPTRRLLVAQFYNLLLMAAALPRLFEEGFGQRALRHALLVALVAGASLQLRGLWTFTRTPIASNSRSLPYTEWRYDFYIKPPLIEAARRVIAEVEAGRRVVLVYTFRALEENTTDPAAVLERIYLHLGHRRFWESVLVFSDLRCRYSCIPVIPLAQARERLAALGPLEDVVAFKNEVPEQPPFVAEAHRVWEALGELYEIVSPSGAEFAAEAARPLRRYRLRRRTAAGSVSAAAFPAPPVTPLPAGGRAR